MPMLSERWPATGTHVTAYRRKDQTQGGGREALKCSPPECASTSYRITEGPGGRHRMTCLGCGTYSVEADRPSTCHMVEWELLEAQDPPAGSAR